MTQEEFEHKHHIKLLSNHFLENDWVWLYKKQHYKDGAIDIYYKYWCYLVAPSKIINALSSYIVDIPDDTRGALINGCVYKPFVHDGFEPLTIIRDFKNGAERFAQIRITEEIIFYHNLYEVHKENTRLFFDDKDVLVCEVTDTSARILNRYLKEFMAAKKMDLVCHCQSEIEYNINEYSPNFKYKCTSEQGEDISQTDSQQYNIMVNPCFTQMRNWFNGKSVANHTPLKCYQKSMNTQYIIATDKNGVDILSDENTFPYTPIFFDKKLLSLYMGHEKHSVDSLRITTPDFSIRCDNDNENYIVAFLKDVLDLPHREQIVWKGYNIASDGRSFSKHFQETMVQGNWNSFAESIDFGFRDTYKTLLKKWEDYYKFPIFKPLNHAQSEIPDKINLLQDNDYFALSSLLQQIGLMFYDSLNKEELYKNILEPTEQEKKGASIAYLHRLFGELKIDDIDFNTFLKNARTLRSIFSLAHRNSIRITDTNEKKALTYVGLSIDKMNTKEATKILLEKGCAAMQKIIEQL